LSMLHLAIMLPFLAACFIPLLRRFSGRIHAGWIALPVPLLLFLAFASRVASVRSEGAQQESLAWIPSLGIDITLYLDGLSLLFALLISGIGMLVIFYSIYYMDAGREALHRFYCYLMLFMGAMLGVVLSDNVMVLYGFWELTSISSFLLIAFWHKRAKSRDGAMKSMLITVFGGLAMFAGLLLLSIMGDSFSVRELIGQAEQLSQSPLFTPAMLLILTGAFTKSAQFPFHIWLPDAMEAPTPVSAYLHSATMVKAGLYLVSRLSPVFAGQAEWFWLVTGFGLTTMVYASYRALKQTDLKALLAFSTVSQLGLIMCLLGLGSASSYYGGSADGMLYAKATTAAIFHLINHAIFKGALFMVVGIIDHGTGTRDIRKLGGLMALMPITFSVSVIGALSMAGMPPFSGFLSKEMFFTAVLQASEMSMWSMSTWGALIPIIAWVGSVFTFVYSLIIVLRTFAGRYRPEKLETTPHEASFGLLLPPMLLASLAIVFGLFPNLLSYSLIEPAIASISPGLLSAGESFHVHISFWHGFTTELFMTAGILAAGTVLYVLHGRMKAIHAPLAMKPSWNGLYNWGMRAVGPASKRFTSRYMTGSIRHYVSYILVFLIVSLTAVLLTTEGIRFDASGYAPISFYEGTAILALIVSAIAIPFVSSRLTAIILTGMTGYMVTLFFVLFRAPDLALTQMTVETVSVMLFLLCFYHLPKLKKERIPLRVKIPNLLISIGVGAVVTVIALSAGSDAPFESIAGYFLENSYKEAGGKNVVNVILVDFRGFDTLLEITVLGIAALGIYALIKLEPGDASLPVRSPRDAGPRQPGTGRINDVILRTVSKLAIPIVLAFSWYLFYSGHHHPGGGFIGGLMTSAALVLLSMSAGMNATARMIPVNYRIVIGIGLLTALLTGIGSFAAGVPFLSHSFGYFDIPLLGETELATAVLFDLGVYLAVVGVTMTIIYTIGRDN
jgi:multicomponent Na+:H+ antiporter subunit A